MSLGSTSLGASRALQEATACLHTTSKTSTIGHYWITVLKGALVGSRVATDILNTERAHSVNSVRNNSTELIELSKTGLDWHFHFKPTLCSNSDTWKLLPGSVLRLPRDYWTFYKKKQSWMKKNLCTKVFLQEDWDLDSVSSIWKVTSCKFHIPRAHNYWKGQPIPLHPAETGSLSSKAGKIHRPRRYKPLCRPREITLPISVIPSHQLWAQSLNSPCLWTMSHHITKWWTEIQPARTL